MRGSTGNLGKAIFEPCSDAYLSMKSPGKETLFLVFKMAEYIVSVAFLFLHFETFLTMYKKKKS